MRKAIVIFVMLVVTSIYAKETCKITCPKSKESSEVICIQEKNDLKKVAKCECENGKAIARCLHINNAGYIYDYYKGKSTKMLYETDAAKKKTPGK